MTPIFIVTGAAGFLGSNFVRFLIEVGLDCRIIAVDNLSTGNYDYIKRFVKDDRFRFIEQDAGDIDERFLRDVHVDCIFHFAALPRIQPSTVDILDHSDANVRVALSLLQTIIRAESFDTKFVYSGSSAVYGNATQLPTPETAAISCLNPYAIQKHTVERYLENLATFYPDLKYTILRYFNPSGLNSYNPENRFNAYSSVIGIFKERAKAGKALQITGDGTQRRDFIHADEVAKANLLVFSNYRRNDVYNVGAGRSISINDVAWMISNKIEYVAPRLGEAQETRADVSKFERDFGYAFDKDLRLNEF